MSSPSISCSSGTRTPTIRSVILRRTIVPTRAIPHAIKTPTSWLPTWLQCPSSPPTALPEPKIGLITCCANTPVSSAPIVPPAPCTPKASSASSRSEEHTSELQSHLNLVCRLLLEKKKQNNL